MKRILILLLPFLLLGCPEATSSGDDDGIDYTAPDGYRMTVEEGITYNHTISSFGTNSYVFTPVTSGTYNFKITHCGSDLGIIVDSGELDYLLDADDHLDSSSESGSVSLIAGTSYTVYIDEYDDIESHYSLLISLQ